MFQLPRMFVTIGSAWMNVYQKNDKVTNRSLWPWIEQASRINLQWKHCLI